MASSHQPTVEHERAKYGTPLGEANAWRVSNATAYTWKHEGWGLLAKPTGTNYNGYSIDVIVNVQERQAVDVLISSETQGVPTWNVLAWEDRFASLWRAPLPPDDGPVPPDPPDGDLEARVDRLEVLTVAQGDRIRNLEAALKTAGAAMP